MRFVQISDEPYLFRLLPDNDVEMLVLGAVIAAEVERNRERVSLPEDRDCRAHWEVASRTDDTGNARAAVVIRRPAPPPADPILQVLFVDSDGTEEVARVDAEMYVVTDDPERPTRLEVMYDIPQGEWAPGPDGCGNYLHYGPLLYRWRQ